MIRTPPLKAAFFWSLELLYQRPDSPVISIPVTPESLLTVDCWLWVKKMKIARIISCDWFDSTSDDEARIWYHSGCAGIDVTRHYLGNAVSSSTRCSLRDIPYSPFIWFLINNKQIVSGNAFLNQIYLIENETPPRLSFWIDRDGTAFF